MIYKVKFESRGVLNPFNSWLKLELKGHTVQGGSRWEGRLSRKADSQNGRFFGSEFYRGYVGVLEWIVIG